MSIERPESVKIYMSGDQYNSIPEGIGKIVSKASSLHFLAAQIVSYYYSGNDDSPYRHSFIHDILTNEHTSLSFITNSLKRVLLNLEFNKNFVENIENKMLRIGRLRNKFAHEVFLFNQNQHWLPDRKSIPWHGEGLKFEDEFKNFETLYEEVNKNLVEVIENKKIKMIDHIPDGYKPPTKEFSLRNKPQQYTDRDGSVNLWNDPY